VKGKGERRPGFKRKEKWLEGRGGRAKTTDVPLFTLQGIDVRKKKKEGPVIH